MSKVEFKGFDWTELYEPLTGKPYSKDAAESELAEELRQKLGNTACGWTDEDKTERTRVANLCREFVLACAKFEGYEAPLLRGLAAIEHDVSFLRYMPPLLEYLWT